MCCVVAVDKAYKLLLDPEQKKRALDVIHAGQEYIEHMVNILHTDFSNKHLMRFLFPFFFLM